MPTSNTSILWHIPHQRNPFFTGREDVLSQLHRALRVENTVALSHPQGVSGLGGIGKTQTALEYAYRYRSEYNAVFWVQADSKLTLTSSLVELAHILELPECSKLDQQIIVQAVLHWLRLHPGWLLIYDNIDDLSIAEPFIPKAGLGHLLLTTRAHALGGLAQRMEVQQMDPETGALLLLRRASILSLQAKLGEASSDDRRVAQEISQELDGLPLALDQAGAYMKEAFCSLTVYLALYRRRRQEVLQVRGSIHQDYPASVATTWSLSFEKVEKSKPAADLLRACAFLAPDAIPEQMIITGAHHLSPALQTAAADPLQFDEAIKVLLSYSLVSRSEDAALNVHRLVQAVVQDAFPDEEKEQWMQRTVCSVKEAFHNKELTKWSAQESCVPHALKCLDWIEQHWIEQHQKAFPEAADLYYRTGMFLRISAQYVEAEACFQRGLALWKLLGGADTSFGALCLEGLGQVYKRLGQYDKAEACYLRALRIDQQWLGADHSSAIKFLHDAKILNDDQFLNSATIFNDTKILNGATILSDLAALYQRQGKYAEAEMLFQQSLVTRQKFLGDDNQQVAQSLNNLANLYYDQGKYEQAEPLLRRALSTSEQWDSSHPDTITFRSNLAKVYKKLGKHDKAESLYRQALADCERQPNPNLHIMVAVLNNLAALYHHQGKYTEAESLFLRTLAIDEKLFGSEHLEIATDISNLAQTYMKQGKYEHAEPLFQHALTINQQWLKTDHPEIAQSLSNLAVFYGEQGKYDQAEALFCDALKILEPQHDQNPFDLAQALYNLADLYIRQHKYAQVQPLYQRALTISKQHLGQDHPDVQKRQEDYTSLLQDIQIKHIIISHTMNMVLNQQDQQLPFSPIEYHYSGTGNDKIITHDKDGAHEYKIPFEPPLDTQPDETTLGTDFPHDAQSAEDTFSQQTQHEEELSPQRVSAQKYRAKAVSLYRRKNYKKALQACEKALQLWPDFPEALHTKASVLHANGKYSQALALFEKAINQQPYYAEAHIGKAFSLMESRKFEEALRALDTAIRLAPTIVTVHLHKGIVLHEMGQYTEALASFDDALALQPDKQIAEECFRRKGLAFAFLNRFSEAQIAYEEAIRYNPRSRAHLDKGFLLFATDNPEESLAALKKARVIEPQNASVYYAEGEALMASGQYRKALASYDKAIHYNPNIAQAHFSKGIALGQLGNHREATKAFAESIRLDPTNRDAYGNLSFAFSQLSMHQEAIAALEQGIQLMPDAAELYHKKGVILEGLEQYQAALDAYNRALLINPNHADTYHSKGVLFDKIGETQASLSLFNRALELQPDQFLTHHSKAIVLHKLHRYQEAIDACDAALRLNPGYFPARIRKNSIQRDWKQ